MNFSSKKTPNAPSVSGQTIGETTQNLPALADTEKSGGSAISDQRALTSAVINSTGCWMFLTRAARSWDPLPSNGWRLLPRRDRCGRSMLTMANYR
jgi:hypothetical protein